MNRILLYLNLLLSFISFSQDNSSKVSPVHSGAYSSNSISYIVGKIYVVSEPSTFINNNTMEVVNDDIVLYPNPVTDLITIKTTDKSEIKTISIIDMNGRVVYLNNIRNNIADLSFLERGSYIVILDDDKTKTFKIIKN